MIQEIELRELELYERRAQNVIRDLNKEISNIKESKEKTKKDIDSEIIKKTIELKRLKNESAKKQIEIEEKTKKIYELQKDELSKLPSNYVLNPFTTSLPSSGAILSTDSSFALAPGSKVFTNSYIPLPLASEPRQYIVTCKKCGKNYRSDSYKGGDYVCYNCRK